jgi:hypothetical protein
MTKNISMREWEALSAYLDGQLSAKERTRLETRLEQMPELRSALEDLRQTRSVLRSQPKVRAPRNFTLTPDMVGLKARPVRRAPAYPFFRLASALAGFLFLLVLVGDLSGLPARIGFGGAAESAQVAMAPAAAAPRESAQRASDAYPEPTQNAVEAPAMKAMGTETPPAPLLMQMQPTSTPEPGATPEAPMAAMAVPSTPESTPPAGMGGGEPSTSSTFEPAPGASETLSSSAPATEPQAYPAATQPQPQEQPQAMSEGLPTLRIVEVALALLAVGSGLIAFFLRRAGSA